MDQQQKKTKPKNVNVVQIWEEMFHPFASPVIQPQGLQDAVEMNGPQMRHQFLQVSPGGISRQLSLKKNRGWQKNLKVNKEHGQMWTCWCKQPPYHYLSHFLWFPRFHQIWVI